MSRRKTKTERELVADIKKTHDVFCKKHERCRDCPLGKEKDCRLAYIIQLLELIEDEEE